jgi:amino acid adenylation domain-containing protein/thioester reductase-like protein
MMERSFEMIIAIFAILKAGGAYLPIDPHYPEDRIRYLLKDSCSILVLTQERFMEFAGTIDFDGEVLNLEDELLYQGDPGDLDIVNSPNDLAYIIYTSGSTGNPKGVMIEHVSAINLAVTLYKRYPLEENDAYLLKTAFLFDVSISEIFGWFWGGGRLVILEPGGEKDPLLMLNVIKKEKITHLNFVPSMFNLFVNVLDQQNAAKLAELRYIFLAGEAIWTDSISKFRRLKTRVIIENLYGPTEATVYASWYPVAKWNGVGSISIGKPVDNLKLYILSSCDNNWPGLQPVGIAGELAISGIGLARGYLNRPELTAEKFIDNPFSKQEGWDNTHNKLYRTGDLCRWMYDGNIDYLGRIDFQVKVRGFRIETGEIENKLLNQEKIIEAVVIAREDSAGEKYLTAYLVADQELDIAEVRDALGEEVPEYMVPSYIMQLDEIPLTPSGKVNRKALPNPEITEKEEDYVAPRNRTEEKLAEIWSEVLNINIDIIGIDDNFFNVGGHSLKAALMIAMMHKALNVKIAMHEVFDMPTIRKLAEYIEGAQEVKYFVIKPAPLKEYYLQTSMQKRLFFMDRMEEDSVLYNIPLMDIYHKGTEKNRLEGAARKLIKRHESLRTSFHMIEGEAVQKVHDYETVGADFEIEYFETSEDGMIYSYDPLKEGTSSQIRGVPFQDVVDHFVRPFDLEKPPLLRIGLINIAGAIQILMVDIHHIVSDGVSMVVLLDELWAKYDGKEFPPLPVQYKDYAEWTFEKEQVEERKKQEAFWLQEFEGEISLLNLPTDFPRPAQQSFEGDTVRFEVGVEDTQRLNKLARSQGATLFMVLLAAYNVLLNKLSGQEEIVVGTLTAGRNHADVQNIIGMFVDTLALRSYPEGEKIFDTFLEEIKKKSLAAFENQEYPFEQLVSKVSSRADTNRHPIFDVVFNLENEADQAEYLLETLMLDKSNPYSFKTFNAKFDMMLVVVETEEGLQCSIEYKTKLFKEKTIERFVRYFKTITDSICDDFRQKIGEITIISEEEKREILYEFNDTKKDYPTDKTIHQIFEERMEKFPENIALTYKGDTITYREVNEKANQLARVLRSKGIKTDNMVGIMVERCMEMIVGIMAILKAGGAYLPIDPNYPEDRVRYLFNDSSANLLLTLSKFIDFAGTVDFDGEIMDLEEPSLYQGETGNPENKTDPKDLAYIIYTSGSTGKPKGVMINHVAAVNLLYTLDRMYPLEKSDSYLLKTAFLFDVSVSEIFGWFWRGGRLSILEQGLEKDPLGMIEVIEQEKVTHLNFVPSMFNVFASMLDHNNINKLVSLRYIFLAGEAIWPESVLKFRSFKTETIIENLYGPTEATVYASWYPVAKWGGKGSVSIGEAVDNLKLYILSSDDKARPALQPVGVAGELTISGIQLARGYLNRPELTSRMFVDNPYAYAEDGDENFRKLYHTGDLTRWHADGTIEYMGRIDHQVKVRGFRIELGEIETRLTDLEDVNEAIVIVREDREREKYLCAYLIAQEKLDMASVRERLSEGLPEYMVPSHFVQIDKIPLNPNGKLDRKALPEPEISAVEREYVPPTTEMEILLADIWSEVLGFEKIGIDDNFFEIGGDSLKTILISARLQKRGLRLHVNEFFTCNTIKGLAKRIKNLERVTERGKRTVARDKKLIDMNVKEDYERYLEQVKMEELPDLEMVNDYRHILLTGATGYLGAYLLHDLLDNTEAAIYLPVRGATQEEAEARLRKKLAFYFGEEFFETQKDRIAVVQADLTGERLGINARQYEELCEIVNAVVHSAANVKHYGLYEELYKSNVEATERLLEFSMTGRKKDFHFISTIDTGRGDIPGKDYLLYTEYSHDEGQRLDHVYIKSKLEAEMRVLAYRDKGLNTSIYRAGNITFHSDTGLFQENIENNFFYAIMRGIIKVGFLSDNMRKMKLEMSFVNYTARAIVLLLTRERLRNQIYHVYSPYTMSWNKMAGLLKESGVEVPDIEEERVEEYLTQYEGNSEYEKIIERMKLDSWEWEDLEGTSTLPKNDRTVMILGNLDFRWPAVQKEHIDKMFAHCKEVGFL